MFGKKAVDPDYVRITFQKGEYSSFTALTYPDASRSDAKAAFDSHQKGNRGRVALTCKSGKIVSIDLGPFVAVEVG